jgi:hypothetical protein
MEEKWSREGTSLELRLPFHVSTCNSKHFIRLRARKAVITSRVGTKRDKLMTCRPKATIT